jgi:hypothetical protein
MPFPAIHRQSGSVRVPSVADLKDPTRTASSGHRVIRQCPGGMSGEDRKETIMRLHNVPIVTTYLAWMPAEP